MTTKTVTMWKEKDGKIEVVKTTQLHESVDIKTQTAIAILDTFNWNEDFGAVVRDEPVTCDSSLSVTVSLTHVAKLLQENKNKVMSVCFNKKDGSTRVLTGFHTGQADTFGRFYFTDLEKLSDDNIRLVDPRELNWVQLGRVRTMVKG